jgi:putative hydrolase of the HAD superfamily
LKLSCLVLDAMGVIFKSADDVAELLIPFIVEKSGSTDEKIIQSAYLEASLGEISPDEFWNRVNLAPELEDEFLSRHSLNPGITELLSLARDNGIPVWCLSNDVGRWSVKLRTNLGIENFLAGSIISGDVGVRKPDRAIYEQMIHSCGYRAEDILFVDDRERNVTASRELGIETVMFDPESGFIEIKKWMSQRVL